MPGSLSLRTVGRRRLVLLAAVGVSVLVGAPVVAIAASGSGGHSSAADAAKARAVQLGASLPVYQGTQLQNVLASEAPPAWDTAIGVSLGPTSAVAAAQRAAQNLVLLDNESRELPGGSAAVRGAYVADTAKMAQRQSQVQAAWDGSVASQKVALNRDDLRYLAQHPEVETFDGATMSVQQWNTTTVIGTGAVVTFSGTSQRHSNQTGSWIDEGLHQWQVTLHQDVHGAWHLVTESVLLGADYNEK